jgi:hypothetical protein
LVLRDEPTEVSECDCSSCRRTAGLWHHCPPKSVTVEGEGVSYQKQLPLDPQAGKWSEAETASFRHSPGRA